MDLSGDASQGITHRRNRYFINRQSRKSYRMWRFIYSPLMAQVTQAALGSDAYLFNEQWVVKGPEKGMPFSWHQDSGYVKFRDAATTHEPYLTCWCTLDDVSVENGTVYLLPHSRAGTRDRIVDHIKDPKTNDLIGYHADDPGDPAIIPAGSIVAFSSFVLHRSGPNTTPTFRRVYLSQYSAAPIVHSQTGELFAMAVPFVRNGAIVYDPKVDLPQD